MRTRNRVIGAMLCGMVYATGHAADSLFITAFDSDELEVRLGKDYVLLSKDEFGKPPLPVLDWEKKSNYLKVRLGDGRTVWVSGADVLTSDLDRLRHNCAELTMSRASDSQLPTGRGLGENCK